MADRLKISENDVLYHPNGITLDGFEPLLEPPKTPVLGYLARLCPLKGLDLLVDSFIELKELEKFSDLRLEIAGGMTAEDEPFVEEQRRKLIQAGLEDSFSIRANITREQKLDFLRNLTVFSVPARYPEAFGLYVVEAMAAGLSVVLPNSGSFPELINTTQGGCVYDSDKSGALTNALENALSDPTKAKEMGLQGHRAVSENFANEKLAVALTDQLLSPLPLS